MKILHRYLFAFILCLAVAVPVRAGNKQVTGLTTSAVATIVIPGPHAWFVIIQNLGANAVNVTLDGGTTYSESIGGTTYHGTDPTTGATGLGYVIPAAANGVPGLLVITAQPNTGLLKQVRAIMASGTTTLNIITPDYQSTFPTN